MQSYIEHILTLIYYHFKRLDRIGIIWYIGVAYLLFLLFTAFTITVLDHEKYKKRAWEQQTTIIENPGSRGSIFSSKESLKGFLAVSTNLGNLAVDPSQTGSREKLINFLVETVYSEYCEYSTRPCLENMAAYLRDPSLLTINEISTIDLKNRIATYLNHRMDTPIESELIAENLDEETIQKITAWGEDAIFFVVNHLYVNPTKVIEKGKLAQRIADTLGIKEETIRKKLEIRKKRHLEIIKKMNISTRDFVMRRLDIERRAIKNKELSLEQSILPFIKIEDNLVRFYPEREVMGQITGFVDGEGRGQYGIEGYLEEELQGESPKERIIKDSAGRPIRGQIGESSLLMKRGSDIVLTIDRNIQKELSLRLANAVEKFRANKGSAIVMEPKTGKIIAMVNYPTYDPNAFTQVNDMERVDYTIYKNPFFDLFGVPLFVIDTASGTVYSNIDGQRLSLREATLTEINNFAIPKYKYKNKYGVGVYSNDIISALYEPGSVFKAITVAIGLDTGEIEPEDTYYDRGFVELDYGGGKKGRISNASSKCIGRHTFIHALNWSCNVGMINIVQKIGPSLFHKYIHDFGFGSKSDITLDGEVFSRIDDYNKWSKTQFFTMSFGQGINVSMLQMAAAYSVLANGGIYMKPYIIESILLPDGKKIDTVPTPVRRVIRAETAKKITAMLISGVKNGFAQKGGVPGYTMAGKTGTSQIPYKGGYENKILGQDLGHTITSYGGYAPANNPKFVLIVSINRPRTDQHAENTASALYSEIAEYLLEYYKIPKNQ